MYIKIHVPTFPLTCPRDESQELLGHEVLTSYMYTKLKMTVDKRNVFF